jgi:hypothetical protein
MEWIQKTKLKGVKLTNLPKIPVWNDHWSK